MGLKYSIHLLKCVDQPCPLGAVFAPREIPTVFRFMHHPATDANDFLPPAIFDGVKARERCGRFALSFFETLDGARRRYAALSERVDAVARYGGYIGEMAIKESDGLASVPSGASRHLDLHPFDGVIFAGRVTAYHAA